jgi:RNA polymerase sigma factor (sigma-70 family)
MATAQLNDLLRHLHGLTRIAGVDALDDAELLQRFAAQGEEAAFAALVRRHGPLVLQVCQRLLADPHTTEDVFQATFLVLARKANSLRKPDTVGCFLYGVAYRLACRARAESVRRQIHERRHRVPPPADPLAEVSGRELLAVLEGELNRLPEKFRSPLVLCCLQGRTRDEIARQLKWSLRTLQRRLEQGRALLHARLTRRGLALSALLLSTLLACPPASALPVKLLTATVRAARAFSTATAELAGPASGKAVALAQYLLRSMLLTRLKIATSLLLAFTLLAGGIGALALRTSTVQPPEAQTQRDSAQVSDSQKAPASAAQTPGPVDAERARKTDDAITAGLQWLVRQQTRAGNWSLDGSYKNDVAATAFALLPLLESGQTHRSEGALHPYSRNVERGLRYLRNVQKKDGELDSLMYAHALATEALCEAYRRSKDADLIKPAQRAADFIVQAQHEGGGWGYGPQQRGDTSITTYVIRALASARRAGLKVPEQTLTRAGKFLDSVSNADGSAYQYVPSAPADIGSALSVAGHLSRLELGGDANGKGLAKWTTALRRSAPIDKNPLYFYHFAAPVLRRRGGDDWDFWEPTIRNSLEERQDRGREAPDKKGSWPTAGEPYSQACGRVMTTSLALLTLETCARDDKQPSLTARDLKPRDLEELYAALGDKDFVQARHALRTLAASPRRSVPFLRESLKPVPAVDAARLKQLIADLGSDEFSVRRKATAELEKLGELAHPALREALADKPILEVRRRIEEVLEATDLDNSTPVQRRAVRAVEVLVQVGTPEARRILDKLAAGARGATLTEAAKTGVRRLDKRSSAP